MKKKFLTLLLITVTGISTFTGGCGKSTPSVTDVKNISEEQDVNEVVSADSVNDNTATASKEESKYLGDPTNEVGYIIDADGKVQALDGSRTDGFSSDGTNVFNECNTKVGSISTTSLAEYMKSKYLNLVPEHLFEWYGWDWTEVDLGPLEYKEFKPHSLEYGYIKDDGSEEYVWTGCVGSDPDSMFINSQTVWSRAFDSNVVKVDDNKATTEKGTVYSLEYSGKKLVKITTDVDFGGITYTIFYRLVSQ